MDNHRPLSPIVEHAEPSECAKTRSPPIRYATHPDSMPTQEDLAYISPLKAFLTALVILHHTAPFYGGVGHLSHPSPSHPPYSRLALVAFNALDQTFFMAMFFFLAAFLSKNSLIRRGKGKGTLEFVRRRCWRLGVPALVYSVFGPLTCRVLWAGGRGEPVGLTEAWEDAVGVSDVRGPGWSCAVLLIFDTLLAAGWAVRNQGRVPKDENRTDSPDGDGPRNPDRVSDLKLLASLILFSLFDFLCRTRFPVGTMLTPLNLNLGYLPMYIAAYILGLAVPKPECAIPHARTVLCLAIGSTASGFALARSVHDGLAKGRGPALGGLNTLAGLYAVWNNVTGYLIAAVLLHLFSRHVKSSWTTVSRLAYSAFLVHLPVSTLMASLFEGWEPGPMMKTAGVGAANVVLNWAVAMIWEGLSLAARKRIATPLREHLRTGSAGCRSSRRRATATEECQIEILKGLDDVGC